ncbi:MAG: NAD(P)-dependent oxidoreductase [Pseudomonadales bacterium]
MDSTYHLLDAQKMSTMKNTAKIINTSRGGVVDEDALYEALKNGYLSVERKLKFWVGAAARPKDATPRFPSFA